MQEDRWPGYLLHGIVFLTTVELRSTMVLLLLGVCTSVEARDNRIIIQDNNVLLVDQDSG